MANNWSEYQEECAALFRSMGLDASTDVTIKGVRTSHDIDVVVKSHHVGFDIMWLVECKYWKTPIPKLHVLALREIVSDIGADRGILLCEVGCQSGAIEAANLTNVVITSLQNLRVTASRDLSAMRFRELFDRAEDCRVRYWDLPKDFRIDHGLRSELGDGTSYYGAQSMELCIDLITRAFRGVYPIKTDSLSFLMQFGRDKQFNSPEEVIAAVEPLIKELEEKLDKANSKNAST